MIKTAKKAILTFAVLTLAAGMGACGQTHGVADSEAAQSSEIAIGDQKEETSGGEGKGAENGSGETGDPGSTGFGVLSAGIDSPKFPNLDIVVPTTEPAPSVIRIGTRSWIIKDLQARLMELGFMDNDEPSDYYGEVTAAAVKIYQRQNSLSQDGIVGEETLRAILDENAHYYKAQQGDSGSDIVELQQRLYQLGYLASEGEITGTFDEKTLSAVLKFQQLNGLEQDGKVGRKTMSLVYSEEVKPNMIAYGEKSDLVLAAQKRLRTLGYLTSEPDGTFGLGTAMAIKEFQSRNDLVVDGYLGPGTRERLNSNEAQAFGLVLGDQSDTVTRVQQLLSKWGYLNSQLVTGYYGEATKKAVVDFQKRNNLSSDGSVGAMTMAKLTGDEVRRPAPRHSVPSRQHNASGGSPSGGGNSSSGNGSSENSGAGSDYSYTGGGSVGALLDVAGSKLGCPYVWGAKGPGSFDCSGFVYWCLKQVGVGQSYMTSGGWASGGRGRRIGSFSELQAGDIICVRGHVGICAGGGTVIDASSSNGRVVHRSLGAWWQRNFICGWRIF